MSQSPNLPPYELESAKVFGDDLEHWKIRCAELNRRTEALSQTVDTLEDEISELRANRVALLAAARTARSLLRDLPCSKSAAEIDAVLGAAIAKAEERGT
jgi:hypothetical protein